MPEIDPCAVHCKVKNNNDFDIKDRFDGVPVIIRAGHSVTLDPDAAAHVFGARAGATMESMFLHFTRRAGWNTPAWVGDGTRLKGKTLAQRCWDNLEFGSVVMKQVEVPLSELQDQEAA
jgi:hypothetical protein